MMVLVKLIWYKNKHKDRKLLVSKLILLYKFLLFLFLILHQIKSTNKHERRQKDYFFDV